MTLHGTFVQRWYVPQLPIDYIDTSLVQNTWETIAADLSGGEKGRLWSVRIEQTNNGATQETLELEITINGTAYTCTMAAMNNGTVYFVHINDSLTAGDFTLEHEGTPHQFWSEDTDEAGPFVFTSIGLIRVRQTTTVDGTSAQIECNIKYDLLEGI